MIIGNIDEIPVCHQVLRESLEFLRNIDFSKWERKRHQVNNLRVGVSEYDTLEMNEKKAEQHKKFIDLQYIFKGEELLGITIENDKNIIWREYKQENDSLLYSHVENEEFHVMKKGSFAILYPEDIHRPCLTNKSQSHVVKVVIKIPVELVK